MIIERLLSENEGKTLEFKENILNLKGILKTVVSFSNTAGGQIVIGIRDNDKAVVGVLNPALVEESLSNIIADSIFPKIAPNIEVVNFRDKQLVVVEVYPGPQKPYHLKESDVGSSTYYRIGSTNRLADQYLIEEMKRSVTNQSYDELPLMDLNPEAVNFRVASEYFREIKGLKIEGLETFGNLELNKEDRWEKSSNGCRSPALWG